MFPSTFARLLSIASLAALLTGWHARAGESTDNPSGNSLQQTVVDLSHDDFAVRERATEALWQSGNEALVDDVVQNGSTTEARARAARVQNAYRWGVIPGIDPEIKEEIDRFRLGEERTRIAALDTLMEMGRLRLAARCAGLVRDEMAQKKLTNHLQQKMVRTIPAVIVDGGLDEVRGFLQDLSKLDPNVLPHLRSLETDERPFEERFVVPTPTKVEWRVTNHTTAAQWITSSQPDLAIALLKRKKGNEAAIFDLLQTQGRLADALSALSDDSNGSATPDAILQSYLSNEVAKVEPQLYAKKALGLSNRSPYQPTGLKMPGGLRVGVEFCHRHALTAVLEATGQQLATRVESESPMALPTFAAWAVHYPELRSIAIAAAATAHRLEVPADFAYGALGDQTTAQGAWFGRISTLREQRRLLQAGARNGGWTNLADVDAADLPLATAGRLAMARGDWAIAANAHAEATRQADTLASGAVNAFLTSIAFDRAKHPDKATQWLGYAEAIALNNEPARSLLADTMQRFGDHIGARRNREQLLASYRWPSDRKRIPQNLYFVHTLRSYAVGEFDESVADRVQRSLVMVNEQAVVAFPMGVSDLGSMLQDAAMDACMSLDACLRAKDWEGAGEALAIAHRFIPGDPKSFESFDNSDLTELPKALTQNALRLLAETTALCEEATGFFPASNLCKDRLRQCGESREKLQR